MWTWIARRKVGSASKVYLHADGLPLDEDFEASSSDSGSPTDTKSDGSGGETASDASGDRDVVRGGKKALKKSAEERLQMGKARLLKRP